MTISNIEMYNIVSRHLEDSHVLISAKNEWFKQCVDFFISNNSNCNTKELSSMVAEQLSLSDFQEIALSSLPVNLKYSEKLILNGKYCLQVNTILDVGQSCYSQYNSVVKRDNTNTEIGDIKPAPWEPKLHRMLKMMCTDGQQDIMAMEYESLPCLKEPFIPGFKITVTGPVEYRKGVLLLKSKNVHFIGGEVEHLLIKNAPLNVLCRVLNKPELENPYMFSSIEVDNTNTEIQEFNDINLPKQIENVNKIDQSLLNTIVPQNSTNQTNNSNFIGNGVITYDDFFDGDDDELIYLTQVAEIETKIAESNSTVNATPLHKVDTHQHNSKVNHTTSSTLKVTKVEPNKKPNTIVRQTKISDILGPSTSTSSCSRSESARSQNNRLTYSNNIPSTHLSGKREASSPIKIETKKPLLELNMSEDIWDDIDMEIDISQPLTKVLNSASILKNSKIQVKQNKWICSGVIMNDTKHEEVEFTSEILERLIGISSKEVLQLKNNPLNCNSLKEKIEKGIKGAYRKLHLFKGKMTLTYSINKNAKPIVTDMAL